MAHLPYCTELCIVLSQRTFRQTYNLTSNWHTSNRLRIQSWSIHSRSRSWHRVVAHCRVAVLHLGLLLSGLLGPVIPVSFLIHLHPPSLTVFGSLSCRYSRGRRRVWYAPHSHTFWCLLPGERVSDKKSTICSGSSFRNGVTNPMIHRLPSGSRIGQ